MSEASASASLIGRQVGNFRVGRLLGSGAMGSVYLLEHAQLPNTFAALKVLKAGGASPQAMKERFVQEALVAAAIGGHRVARPLDLGRFEDGTPYIVMEYVHGRTLADACDGAGVLPLPAALKIAFRVADTMALAHARGIVHRDLKPSNIMLVGAEEDPRVKILDFGVARADGEIKLAETRENAIIGSPGYMSPEAASAQPVDGKTDVFSLGVILFKMLSGALPFGSSNDRTTLAALLTQSAGLVGARRTGDLEPVPDGVEQLLAGALAKEPAERISMEALRDALLVELRAISPGEAPSVVEPTPQPSTPRNVDVLAATLELDSDDQAVPDLDRMRERVKEFAAARLPGSTGGPSATQKTPAPRRAWLLALVSLAVIGAAGLLIGRTLRRPPAPPAEAAHDAPPVELRPRQVTFDGRVANVQLSPDGKTMMYLTNGKLIQRDLSSRASRTVADDVNDISWGIDADHFVYSRYTTELHRYVASRAGGEAHEQTPYRGFAAFRDDGREVAHHWMPAKKLIITGPDFDKVLREIPIAGDYTFMPWAEWSPLGDRLIVLTVKGTENTLWSIGADGKDQKSLLTGTLEMAHFGRSADDLVVLRCAPGDSLDCDLVRLPDRVLVSHAPIQDFSLSRDGKALVFVRNASYGDLWMVTLGGKQPQAKQLTNDTARKVFNPISPDGRWLAYSVYDGSLSEARVMPVEGGAYRVVTTARGPIGCMVWSPDGKQLAYRAQVTDPNALFVIDAAGGTPRKIPLQHPSGDDQHLAWAPGSRVLYHGEGNRSFRVLDPLTGEDKSLVDEKEPGWMFAAWYSPDAKQVAVLWNRKPSQSLYLIEVATGAFRQLNAADATPLGFSPDGRWVLAREKREFVKFAVADGKRQPWVTLPAAMSSDSTSCRPSPDMKRLACEVSVPRSDVWMVDDFDRASR